MCQERRGFNFLLVNKILCRVSELTNLVLKVALNTTEKQLRSEFDALKREMEDKEEALMAENKKLSNTIADLEVLN